MIRDRKIRTALSVFLLLVAIWIAFPKVHVHHFLKHQHTHTVPGSGTEVRSSAAPDCDFEKFDKPVYFSVFQFVSNFLPFAGPRSDGSAHSISWLITGAHSILSLRGPPASL